MSLPYPLPPGVRATTFTYENGETTTVYRMRPEEHGPIYAKHDGRRALIYEHWSYVIVWYEDTREGKVFHGGLEDNPEHWMWLPQHRPSLPIPYRVETFAAWCREWVQAEVRRWNLDG